MKPSPGYALEVITDGTRMITRFDDVEKAVAALTSAASARDSLSVELHVLLPVKKEA